MLLLLRYCFYIIYCVIVMVVLGGVAGGVAHGAKVGARIMYIDAFSPTPLFLLYAMSCTLNQQHHSLSLRIPESPVLYPA